MPSKSIALLTIPFLPLRGTLVFPHMVLHIDVGRGKSVAAINQAMMGDQRIFLVMQKDIENEEPALNDLYRAGTIARVKQVLHLPGNNMRVLIEGEERAILKAVHEDKETWVATVRTMPPFDKSQDNPELQALISLA